MRFVLAVLGAFMVTTGISVGAEARGADKTTPADFHVAVGGKDTNPGTAAAPFATLAKARDAVRGKIKAGLTQNIIVQIRGGTYRQTETLTFGPEDSGTEKFSITYAAAPGEKVLLSGGRKIAGWKKGAGKRAHISCQYDEVEPLLAELDPRGIILVTNAPSVEAADTLLENAKRWSRRGIHAVS